MIAPITILVALIILAISLGVFIILKPSLALTPGGKMLCFVSLFILPVLAASLGVSEHVERSKTTQFCLSCHVMADYGRSLHVDDRSYMPAVHFQNGLVPRDRACYTCHTDYSLYGDAKAKLRGLRHIYVQYLGVLPAKLHIYRPYHNRECLHCHAGARSFEEGATHLSRPEVLPNVKANQLSCLSSGCHEIVHEVGSLKDATFWKGSP